MVHLDALCYAVPSFRSEVLPRNNINAQSCHSDSLVTIKLVWDPTDAVLCYCEGDGTGEGGGAHHDRHVTYDPRRGGLLVENRMGKPRRYPRSWPYSLYL